MNRLEIIKALSLIPERDKRILEVRVCSRKEKMDHYADIFIFKEDSGFLNSEEEVRKFMTRYVPAKIIDKVSEKTVDWVEPYDESNTVSLLNTGHHYIKFKPDDSSLSALLFNNRVLSMFGSSGDKNNYGFG